MSRRSPTLRFDDRVAIVTGAGAGLGREYARAFAARGARVVVNGRSPANVAETVDAIRAAGGTAIASVTDVAAEGAAERIVSAAVDVWGRLDALVNNAGPGRTGSPDELSWEAYDEELGTSVTASLALGLAAWPHLRACGAGRIVNTSSSAIFGIPGSIPYSTAKAAVIGLTRSLASDGAGDGIRVNAVMPFGLTQMNADLPEAVSRDYHEHFPAAEAASLVLLLAHERAPVSGEVFLTGGGFAARVALVVGRGVAGDTATPESLLDQFDDVLSLDGAVAPDGGVAARQHAVRRLTEPREPS